MNFNDTQGVYTYTFEAEKAVSICLSVCLRSKYIFLATDPDYVIHLSNECLLCESY